MSEKTGRAEQWVAELSKHFGPVYAALVKRLASRERAIATDAMDLDVMNANAVTAHLVTLHELNGARMAAFVALRATGVMKDPVSPETVTDHVRQLLMRWQADSEPLPKNATPA